MSGGGTSGGGRSLQANYIENAHSLVLAGQRIDSAGGLQSRIDSTFDNTFTSTNMLSTLAAALNATTPYTSEEAYNPDTDLLQLESPVENYTTTLEAVNPDNDLQKLVQKMHEIVEQDMDTDLDFENMISDIDTGNRVDHLKSMNRILSSASDGLMFSNNTVGVAMALSEAERENRLMTRRAELSNLWEQNRQQNLRSLVQLWMQGYSDAITKQQQFASTQITAKVEQYGINLDYEVKEALWDLELYKYISNLFGSVHGSVQPGPNEPNRVKSALAGGIGLGAAGGFAAQQGWLGATAAANPLLGLGLGAALGIGLGLFGD